MKASMRVAMEHLFARYRDIRPLFLALARPIKDEWNIKPYFGVLPLVFRARNSAFSAPRICTVDAGAFAKFVREPASSHMAISKLTYKHKNIKHADLRTGVSQQCVGQHNLGV